MIFSTYQFLKDQYAICLKNFHKKQLQFITLLPKKYNLKAWLEATKRASKSTEKRLVLGLAKLKIDLSFLNESQNTAIMSFNFYSTIWFLQTIMDRKEPLEISR
jgi:hypothetical protein